MVLLFHQDFKFLSLFRGQNVPNLLPRITPYQLELRNDQLPQIAGALLALGDNFLNLITLFFRKLQFVIQLLHELFLQKIRAHLWRGQVGNLRLPGRRRRMGVHRALNMLHEQSAGDNTRAKDHDGRENDFPGIHWAWSLWSTEAKSVLSKFWERSSLVFVAGLKNDHAPHNSAMAAQETAACHNPRTHNAALSVGVTAGINAMMRFSNA